MLVKVKCFHCGEDCNEGDIIVDEHHFCCNGCKTIYELLSENNLGVYYKLERTPGSTIDEMSSNSKYAYLDLPEAQEQLLDFEENGLSIITLTVPKIHCTSCVYLLENLPKLDEGIKSVLVNFVKRKATITFYNEIISLRQVIELLAKIGYHPDLSLKKEASQKLASPNRSLLYKIGLAGFCFGNIMLLSFPEYLAVNEEILKEYQPFFGILNFVLALPVLLYCAQDYFINAWVNFRQRIIGIDVPIVLGILALFIRSSYEIFGQYGAGYMDSLTGLIFFLLIGKWYQSRTHEALAFNRNYTSYFPLATTKINEEGTEQQVLIDQLQPGDTIKVGHQEIIPADSELLSDDASIDYSFVSGESHSIHKSQGEKLYAGGRQIGTSIRLKVLQKVNQSYFTQLWNHPIFKKEDKAVLSQTINGISKYFTMGILAIAFSTLIYWWSIDITIALTAFSAVLIIACPCALALSAPFAFGNILQYWGREGLYLKNAGVVEQLASVTDIIFDKTGTLTTNKAAQIYFEGTALFDEQKRMIHALTQHSAHPLSQMLTQDLAFTDNTTVVNDFQEKEGQGIMGYIEGNLLKIGSADFVGVAAVPSQRLSSQVYILYNNELWGIFHIDKQYRTGIKEVLQQLGKGYQLHVLSGDNNAEKSTLQQLFGQKSTLLFEQQPMDKLNYIQTLQDQGKKVLMIGDGLNDSGALQQANVGLAVANDVHCFSPASDAIMEAKRLHKLNRYLNISNKTLSIVKASFILSLLYNSVGLYFAIQGLLTPLIAAILMPLSSVSVVIFVTIATNRICAKYL